MLSRLVAVAIVLLFGLGLTVDADKWPVCLDSSTSFSGLPKQVA